jgi:hypothetical protein
MEGRMAGEIPRYLQMPLDGAVLRPPFPFLPSPTSPARTQPDRTANTMSKDTAPTTRQFWDTKVQQFHGGQDWKLCGDGFVEDFSVTTNGLGTPKAALEAARVAVCTLLWWVCG